MEKYDILKNLLDLEKLLCLMYCSGIGEATKESFLSTMEQNFKEVMLVKDRIQELFSRYEDIPKAAEASEVAILLDKFKKMAVELPYMQKQPDVFED